MPETPLPQAETLLAKLIANLQEARLPKNLMMIGIRTGGMWLAERLHSALQLTQPLGVLDISFYRDDIRQRGLSPHAQSSNLPMSVDQLPVMLVDDVLHTGRTIRAALQEIFEVGRPSRVDLTVLVDRGGRELPIQPQFCAVVVSAPDNFRLQLKCEDSTLSLVLEPHHASHSHD